MEGVIQQAAAPEDGLATGNGQAVQEAPRETAVPYAMGWVPELPDVRDYTAETSEVAIIPAVAGGA